MGKMRFTPDRITSLEANEVFVFGSNLAGMHGGGAARLAYEKFGAEWGKGDGLYGQSYAIPTMQGGVETIKPYVDKFIEYAALECDKTYLVTKIGCGIAGFKDEEIAPLFAKAIYYDNIILPESFVKIILSLPPTMPTAVKDMLYGQTKTIIDIVKEMDKEEHFTSWDEAREKLDQFFSAHQRGDETGFNSMRSVWAIMCRNNSSDRKFDIDQFEKELTKFSEERGPLWNGAETVYFRYCISKIIRYASFLNEFRRYRSYEELDEDLRKTVIVNHCGENPRDYFFSLAYRSFWFLSCAAKNTPKIFEGNKFHADEMERALLKDSIDRIQEHGVALFIRENYTFAGCHTDLMVPKDWDVWGQPYRILDDGQAEPLCNGEDRIQGFSTAFETRMALPILETDENYRSVLINDWERVFIPVSDYTRPVIDSSKGILPFRTMEEKKQFIDNALDADRNQR